jgi:hypothetical protein
MYPKAKDCPYTRSICLIVARGVLFSLRALPARPWEAPAQSLGWRAYSGRPWRTTPAPGVTRRPRHHPPPAWADGGRGPRPRPRGDHEAAAAHRESDALLRAAVCPRRVHRDEWPRARPVSAARHDARRPGRGQHRNTACGRATSAEYEVHPLSCRRSRARPLLFRASLDHPTHEGLALSRPLGARPQNDGGKSLRTARLCTIITFQCPILADGVMAWGMTCGSNMEEPARERTSR